MKKTIYLLMVIFLSVFFGMSNCAGAGLIPQAKELQMAHEQSKKRHAEASKSVEATVTEILRFNDLISPLEARHTALTEQESKASNKKEDLKRVVESKEQELLSLLSPAERAAFLQEKATREAAERTRLARAAEDAGRAQALYEEARKKYAVAADETEVTRKRVLRLIEDAAENQKRYAQLLSNEQRAIENNKRLKKEVDEKRLSMSVASRKADEKAAEQAEAERIAKQAAEAAATKAQAERLEEENRKLREAEAAKVAERLDAARKQLEKDYPDIFTQARTKILTLEEKRALLERAKTSSDRVGLGLAIFSLQNSLETSRGSSAENDEKRRAQEAAERAEAERVAKQAADAAQAAKELEEKKEAEAALERARIEAQQKAAQAAREAAAQAKQEAKRPDDDAKTEEFKLPAVRTTVYTRGLSNEGNTCYMNGALQCLMKIGVLNELFFDGSLMRMFMDDAKKAAEAAEVKNAAATEKLVADRRRIALGKGEVFGPPQEAAIRKQRADLAKKDEIVAKGDQLLLQQYVNVLNQTKVDEKTPIPSRAFATEMWPVIQRLSGIMPRNQADASEGINYFIGILPEAIQKSIFGFNTTSNLTCNTCRNVSVKEEPNTVLSLDLKDPLRSSDLSTVLRQYTAPEVLRGDEQVWCATCSTMRDTTKTLSIKTLPQTLIIGFKRFKSVRGRAEKLQTLVSFPLDASMGEISTDDKSAEYSLIGIVMHSGTFDGGHYTAYSKNYSQNRWYFCDDSSVRPVAVPDIEAIAAGTANPYILFYQRKAK